MHDCLYVYVCLLALNDTCMYMHDCLYVYVCLLTVNWYMHDCLYVYVCLLALNGTCMIAYWLPILITHVFVRSSVCLSGRLPVCFLVLSEQIYS